MTINSTVVHQVSKELMASNTISEVNTSITYDYEHNEFSEVCFRLKRGQTQLLEEFKKVEGKSREKSRGNVTSPCGGIRMVPV